MTAFHSNWTKPYFFRNGHIPYAAEDYEILATILSALQWRKKNGRIKMITDTAGAEYYRELQSDQEKRRNFCMSCIKRIALDFPGELETLANMGILAPYFKGEHSFKEVTHEHKSA